MRTMLTVAILLALAGPALAGASPQTLANIETAEAEGIIDHDEAALNIIYTLFDRARVDARFLVAGEPPLKCGTHLIHGLQTDDSLGDAVRAVLAGYLDVGPTDRDFYISPSGIFQITYTVGGGSGVSAVDVDPANGTPDFIDNIAAYMDYSWQYEVTDIGFTAPLIVGSYYQVNITNLSGVYGYTTIWSGTTRITLDNDYIGFPPNDDPDGDALGAAKVTCAHEFKHASQYTCSNWSEGGWVELDATWAEELVYPASNDYHTYVQASGSPLSTPQVSLEFGGSGSYEDCIWQQAMSEKWGNQMIVELWEYRDLWPAASMMASYNYILGVYGSDLPSFMAEWTRWNYLTGYKSHTDWDGGPGEGGYPDSPLLYSCHTWYQAAGLGTPTSVPVQGYASRYARHYSLTALEHFPKIVFNGDDSVDFRPQVIVKMTDGTLMFDAVPVDSNADGTHTLSIPFSQIEELGVAFPSCTQGLVYKSFNYELQQEVVTGVDPLGAAAMKLHPVFPNPFNPKTKIRFELAEASPVHLTVVSAGGRVLRTLAKGEVHAAGEHELLFDGRDDGGQALASGIYFAMLNIGGSESRLAKMALVK